MNFRTSKAVLSIFLICSLLSACGSNLWGTPDYSQGITPTNTPSESAPLPTSTVTQTPTKTSLPPETTTSESIVSSSTPSYSHISTPNSPGSSTSYVTQSGDSLSVVAAHFGVNESDITSASPLPDSGYINPGTTVFIVKNPSLGDTIPSQRIMPDSELVDSPSAVGFDIQGFIDSGGGRLSSFQEYMATVGVITGAQGVERISIGSSISPRLILTIIQYYTGWVEGQPKPDVSDKYPLGYQNYAYPGLYQQLRLAVVDLLTGYYGWREGTLTDLTFPDKTTLRIAPDLNAGTVALQYMFSKKLNYTDWLDAINPDTGFMSLFTSMFGDPWIRAQELGPLFPDDLTQPVFSLPFEIGRKWSFTNGPHPAWEQQSALAALDFAPPMDAPGCGESDAWLVAIAAGLIVRSEGGYVVLDLDRDGFEQTGWVVLYMHVATKDRIPVGTTVDAGTRIGHPSCEGGTATGTHVHIARKYNGEWVAAGGPVPFIMSGWLPQEGVSHNNGFWEGTLTKGDQTVIASAVGAKSSQIIRQVGE